MALFPSTAREPQYGDDDVFEVGAVLPHKNGVGFDLVIPIGMAVSGRIVCMPPSDDKTAS